MGANIENLSLDDGTAEIVLLCHILEVPSRSSLLNLDALLAHEDHIIAVLAAKSSGKYPLDDGARKDCLSEDTE